MGCLTIELLYSLRNYRYYDFVKVLYNTCTGDIILR